MNKVVMIAIPIVIILSIIGFVYSFELGVEDEPISVNEPELEIPQGKNLTISLNEGIGISGS